MTNLNVYHSLRGKNENVLNDLNYTNNISMHNSEEFY